MEYTIEWGDTLSSLAKKYNTTVSDLATLNKIADPNKIYAGQKITIPDVVSQLQGADLNASNIKPGLPEINVEQTPPPTPTTADAIEKYTTDQLKNIQEERKKIQETIGVQSGETTAQTLIGLAQKAPTLDKATKLKEEMATSGATDLGNKLMVENTKLGVLKAELDGLNIAEQNEITSLQGITRGAIDREISVIQRKYNSLKANKQAEYLVQAATVSALQGNYELAKQAAQDAVNAYVYDYEQNVKTFDTIFNIYSDALRGFDEEEKNILKIAAQNAQNQLDEIRTEKEKVADYMVEYNAYGAGITLNDTLDEARQKASKAQGVKVAQSKTTTDGMSEEELTSVLNGVYDYLEKNPDKSPLEAISSLPTAQRTAVLNAYYLTQAFQEEQITKPKTDALSVISGGDITETSVQNAINAGATNDEILSAAGKNSAKVIEILGSLSKKVRDERLYGAGKSISGGIKSISNISISKTKEALKEKAQDVVEFISPFLRGLTE